MTSGLCLYPNVSHSVIVSVSVSFSLLFQEQEKAEKSLKRESTLKEVESCTKQLRELLDQHNTTGTTLPPSDDMKVGPKQRHL